MPVASRRLRHARRLKRQNTLLFRALAQQHQQLEQAAVLIQQLVNARDSALAFAVQPSDPQPSLPSDQPAQ